MVKVQLSIKGPEDYILANYKFHLKLLVSTHVVYERRSVMHKLDLTGGKCPKFQIAH